MGPPTTTPSRVDPAVGDGLGIAGAHALAATLRVVVGVPHERLRNALADWLEQSDGIRVVSRVPDAASAVRAAREQDADVVLLGKALVGDAVGVPLYDVIGALGGIPVVIAGLDGSSAYEAAFKAAGAAEYLVLDMDIDGLSDALWRAARRGPHA